jgi:prophage regulatory protein
MTAMPTETSPDSRGTRIIRRKDLLAQLGISEVTLWRWEQAGTFPRARRLGPRRVGYLESEVSAWIASRPTTEAKPPVALTTTPNGAHEPAVPHRHPSQTPLVVRASREATRAPRRGCYR